MPRNYSSRSYNLVETEKEYAVSDPQGENIYITSRKKASLPPLNGSIERPVTRRRSNRGKGKSPSVASRHIEGMDKADGTPLSAMQSSTRASSAASTQSKDDSRIQFETQSDDILGVNPLLYKTSGNNKSTSLRIYKNGDPNFQPLIYTFKAGHIIPNLEILLNKLSDIIDLSRGARFLFGTNGTRKHQLEELTDGGTYVVSSTRKFENLAYGRRRTTLYNRGRGGPKFGSSISRKNGLINTSSGSSNCSKPDSREGRRIQIINPINQINPEVSVLVNSKTAQSWEDFVADLGQTLKLRGNILLFTLDGDEVKSFSQFNNEYSKEDIFNVKMTDKIEPRAQRILKEQKDEKVMTTLQVNGVLLNAESRATSSMSMRKLSLHRASSEPNLLRDNGQNSNEFSDGRPVAIVIRGQRRHLFPPSHPITHNPSMPQQKLCLDWVYGYRGTDSRRNLLVVNSGELVYFVSAIVILYYRKEDIQRHYTEHTEDIQCIAKHPTRSVIASGQRASRFDKMSAHVRIWSTKSLATLQILGRKELGVGVLSLAFSIKNGGQYLLAVDADQEHLLSVWLWNSEKIFGKVATHHDNVNGCGFHPMDNNLIITYGKSLLTLWNRRKDGIFQRRDLIDETSDRTITSLEFTAEEGDLITGDSQGNISVWTVDIDGRYFIKAEFEAHDGQISALQQLSEGTILSVGEKDRQIIAWDTSEEFDIIAKTKLPDSVGPLRAIYPQSPGESDGNIYVATSKNMVLEGSLQRRFNQIIFGHSKQLWALSVNGYDGTITTAGYDRQIVKWRENKPVWRIQAQSECVSITVHPKGAVIATGTIDGHLIFLNSLTGVHITVMRICGSPVSCLAYNSKGLMLAVGSQNGSIYLFNSSKEGFIHSRLKRMSGSQPISFMDWSTSEKYLQCATSNYDLIYWNVRDSSVIQDVEDIKDETWITQSCPLNYMIHGIWSNQKGSPLIISTDKSEKLKLLISGDADGFLRLHRYPAVSTKAAYAEQKLYTSYISSVKFSPSDDYIYTTGGTDAALMRWSLK